MDILWTTMDYNLYLNMSDLSVISSFRSMSLHTNSSSSISTNWTPTLPVTTPDGYTNHTVHINWIEVVLELLILVIGVAGNMASLLVMIQSKWGGTGIWTRALLMSLSVSDTLVLLTHVFNQQFTTVFLTLDIRSLSNVGCKVFFVMYRSSKMASSWFVAGLCFERFIAVWGTIDISTKFTSFRTTVYTSLICFIAVTFNSVYSFTTRVRGEECTKGFDNLGNKAAYRIFLFVELILYIVVPLFLLSLFTPFIIKKLFEHYQKLKALTGKSCKSNNRRLHEVTRTTVSLMLIVTTYMILLLPMATFQQMIYWKKLDSKSLKTSSFRLVAQRLEQLNYGINFFLYICSCSKFRRGLKHLLTFGKTELNSDPSSSRQWSRSPEQQH